MQGRHHGAHRVGQDGLERSNLAAQAQGPWQLARLPDQGDVGFASFATCSRATSRKSGCC